MSVINEYLVSVKRQYPDTQAVREQLEELRDTLHLKTEDLQAQGKTYDEAAREAIDAIGDVSHLLDEVSGNVKTVNINLLRRNNALANSAMIYTAFITMWVAQLLAASMNYLLIVPFAISTLILFAGLGIWILVTSAMYRRDAKETKVVEFSYRKQFRRALFGWPLITILLFVLNLLLPGGGGWFFYPAILALSWPAGVFIYHKQLAGGRYDA